MFVQVRNVGRVRVLDASGLQQTMRADKVPAYKQLLQQLHGANRDRLDQALRCFTSERQLAVFVLSDYDLIATARACRSDPAIVWVHDVVVAQKWRQPRRGLGALVVGALEREIHANWCRVHSCLLRLTSHPRRKTEPFTSPKDSR